jgi:hypothetical protein
MTSSSSLYGTVTTQNASSTNSTSLYGGADTPIPDSSGNVVVRGDLYVLSGNILTTATTGNIFPANATTINLGLAATAVNIGAGTGTTTINNNLVAQSADFGNITIAVADDQTITTTSGELRLGSASGDVKLEGIDTLYTDTTGTFNLLNAPTTVFAFRNATTLSLGEDTGTTTINNNLTVDGDTITVAQGTTIAYNENNSRFNRPNFQSTSGNTSGVRAIGPNTTSSSRGVISAFSSSDLDNGSFINIQASNGGTDPLRIQTGEYTGGVLGGTTGISFVDNATTYATVNPAGTTVNSDLATKLYVDNAIATTPGSELVNGIYTFALESDGSVTSPGNYNLAQGTVFLYDENNDRLNRPAVQSTSGNSSGFRVVAPNATTSASAVLSTFNTNDLDNGKFINIQARGNATTPLRITTGEYVAGVLGASGDSIVFVDGGAAAHASINPAGPSASTDLTTVAYVSSVIGDPTKLVNGAFELVLNSDGTVDFPNYTFPVADGTSNQVLRTDGAGNLSWYSPSDLNTTYTINASSTTGGANFNLVGSDASTDTIKFASGTGVTVSQTSASEVGIAIGQAVGTSDNVTFAGVTLDTLVNLNTATLTTSATTANQVADSFTAATYRTCKYVIQITSGSAYQAVEALLVHDGSSAFINTYSDVRTGANLSSIGAAVNGANIELQVTPVNAVTTYKISKTLIAV